MTRSGTLLRGAINGLGTPENRKALEEAPEKVRLRVIEAYETHIERQTELDQECTEIFDGLAEKLRRG